MPFSTYVYATNLPCAPLSTALDSRYCKSFGERVKDQQTKAPVQKVERPTQAAPLVQLKEQVAGLPYREQEAALRPGRPLQFNAPQLQLTDGSDSRGNTRQARVQSGQAPSVELHGFRGVRSVRGKRVPRYQGGDWTGVSAQTMDPAKPDEKSELDEIARCHQRDHLIIAGHVGVSADDGATVYGLTPRFPEGMSPAEGIRHLYEHTMTFEGVVANDKPVFDRAKNYHANRGWDTNVVVASRPVAKKAQADLLARLQQLAGMAPGSHGIYYSFPLRDARDGQYFVDTPGPAGKVVKGENQGNCATFPGFIDVALPERSGNLRYYMQELEREASGSSGSRR